MYEYYSQAVVLDAQPVGEADVRYSLFTKRFGKLVVRGKSTRKITSKLAGHLEVGNLIAARVVEHGTLQVVDALKNRRLSHSSANLYVLHRLLHEGERDERLWTVLLARDWSWVNGLRLLGWDPEHARCAKCRAERPENFYIRGQEFFCTRCLSASAGTSKLPVGEVISLIG